MSANHLMKIKKNSRGLGVTAGRKPIKDGEPTVTYTMRLAESQREKLERLGGAQWIRDRINSARG